MSEKSLRGCTLHSALFCFVVLCSGVFFEGIFFNAPDYVSKTDGPRAKAAYRICGLGSQREREEGANPRISRTGPEWEVRDHHNLRARPDSR